MWPREPIDDAVRSLPRGWQFVTRPSLRFATHFSYVLGYIGAVYAPSRRQPAFSFHIDSAVSKTDCRSICSWNYFTCPIDLWAALSIGDIFTRNWLLCGGRALQRSLCIVHNSFRSGAVKCPRSFSVFSGVRYRSFPRTCPSTVYVAR